MIDTENGKLMGFSQFEIRDGEGYISDLLPAPEYKDDFEAMFILGRQTMNFIDLCGIHTVKACATAADERLIKAIGFKASGDEYFCKSKTLPAEVKVEAEELFKFMSEVK